MLAVHCERRDASLDKDQILTVLALHGDSGSICELAPLAEGEQAHEIPWRQAVEKGRAQHLILLSQARRVPLTSDEHRHPKVDAHEEGGPSQRDAKRIGM